MNKNNIGGLKQRLQAAKSVKDVEVLLGEGKTYQEANKKTRDQWARVAKRLSEALAVDDKKPAKNTAKGK